MSEPVALVDLDGTLADFEGAMLAQMKTLAAPGESFYWDGNRDDEPAHIKARRRMVKRQPGFWLGLAELPLGFDVLQMCVDLDYGITILSKAPGPKSGFNAWSEKAEWCNNHVRPRCIDLSVSLVENKGLHYGRVLVDDWPPYVVPWLKYRRRGLVIMPAAHYNEGFEHPQVIRFDGTNVLQVRKALREQREATE